MSTYIAKIQIGNDSSNIIAISDTIFGTCATSAATAAKAVMIRNNVLDRLFDGMQIRVRFNSGNTATSGVSISFVDTNNNAISTINSCSVLGDCTCEAGEVIAFTYDNDNGTANWRVTGQDINETIKAYVSSATADVLSAGHGMIFKGTLGAAGSTPTPTRTTVPNGTNSNINEKYSAGWTYKITSADTYAGHTCEVGDLLIAIADATTGQTSINNDHWTVAQGNIDGAVTGPASSTAGHIATFSDGNGKHIQDSGFTIATSVPANAVFTDTNTSYKYTISAPSATVYNGTDTFNANAATSKVLASVLNGVLILEQGITFTTASVASSASLDESAVAGPAISNS